MIKIDNKQSCSGCSACVQACPKQCISFEEDEQGFRYPSVNNELCVNCGLCEKVCPCINENEQTIPLDIYAAKNPDEEIRKDSSSGGIFTMLAESIIDEGGVVFGARFNEKWNVVHDYTVIKFISWLPFEKLDPITLNTDDKLYNRLADLVNSFKEDVLKEGGRLQEGKI